MKFNLKTASLGALATLSLLAAPLVITHSAHADDGGQGRGHHLEQLDLSADQRSQIEAIRTSAIGQMQSVLTAEQRSQLESSEARGPRAWRQLDLSDSQRSEIRSIRSASREQVQSILTTEQQTQLEELREQRGARRSERRSERRAE